MTFFTVVTRGLIRRPVRTGLTILGISVGIAAVVALVGISRGFSKSWETGLKARGTDVVVSNMVSSLVPKPFSASVRDRIAHLLNAWCPGQSRPPVRPGGVLLGDRVPAKGPPGGACSGAS